MGKIRDVFKKIGDTEGLFHAKMGIIKDRNIKDITEAGEIKKWQQEYTEQYKKDFYDPDNQNGMITSLECEVSWALLQTMLVKVKEFQLS